MTRAQTQTGQGRMHATRHGLDEGARRSMVATLNRRLADATDLYLQAKHAHWNVKGTGFYHLHLLFDKLAKTLEQHADHIAERATALGGDAQGTVRMAAQASSLQEFPAAPQGERAFVEALADRFAQHAKRITEDVERAEENGDRGTADLLGEIARELDEGLYLLESHLQGGSREAGA